MKFGADQKPRESGGEKLCFSNCEAIAYLYNEQAPQTCSHYTDTTRWGGFFMLQKLADPLKPLPN
jgi:hypothetical protein